MQSLSGIAYETSEQHKDISKARQTRDVSDTLDIISYLSERNPFANNSCLHSISNGVIAQASVNVDTSRKVRELVLEKMVVTID